MMNVPTTRSGIGPASISSTTSSRKRRRIRSSLAVCLVLAVTSARAVASPVWLPRHTRLVYRFESTSSSVTNPGALLGKPEASGRSTTIQSSIKASLEIRVGDQVTFLFDDPHVIFQVNGQDAPTQANEIARGLRTVAVASVRADGKIESVRFGEGLSHLARTYAQTLLSMIQFVAAPGGETWTSMEEDP